jgi:hypothetical protein
MFFVLAFGPASAEAAHLSGYTHRGVTVKIATDAQGRATAAVYLWHVRRCDLGRYSYGGATGVDSKKRPAAQFFTRNPYTVRDRGGFRTRVTVHSSARRLSIYRWRGTFSVVAVIRRHGRVVDRCHIRRLHWTASTPEARLDLTGEQNDGMVGPHSLSYATPTNHITLTGDANRVVIQAGPWYLAIKAPFHHRLKPGRYQHATREAFSGRKAGIDLSGNGTGCNEINGEFTVTRSKFDRRGGVRLLVLSFVQHCDSAEGATRGTLTYRR